MARVKKAYRKKALELHPDRNYGNVETATKHFADVQAAYEFLSDPQERAWYDSHRDAILRGVENSSELHYKSTVRVTTTADIFGYISQYNGQLEYSDSDRGFYTTVRCVFDKLAMEERESCEWESIEYPNFPSFGKANDDYSEIAKPFYKVWSNFSTEKTFSWEDRFRTADAPDRRVRRMMEKENKRCREEGIREFNEAVRSLVAFIKKRDPRYVPTSQSEADRQKVLRHAAATQAARSRAANQAKLDVQTQPEWTKVEPAVGNVFEESSDDDREEFECVVCSKLFKSEQQWQAHEKSKKHLKAAQQLRKKMESENKALGLNKENSEDVVIHTPGRDVSATNSGTETGAANGLASPVGEDPKSMEVHDPTGKICNAHMAPPYPHSISGSEAESFSSNSDNIYSPRKTVEVRSSSRKTDHHSRISESNIEPVGMSQSLAKLALSNDQETTPTSGVKIGKAKEKRAKKAMHQTGTSSQMKEDQASPMTIG